MPDIWRMPYYGPPVQCRCWRSTESGNAGTSIIPADDNMKLRKSTEAGAYIVELVKKDIRPSQLITKETL